ncbi:MerR family transcriptional regulator [Luteococcus sp.]|uniref:MerR family transcriptional regulator n=1 Tax=Luteococcus sp. TaxID=1969402 RepID=UPI00373669DA
MAETPELFSIGEFSRLTRLSVRMLRHYDATGVLVPAAVDPWTGYRHYSPDQLPDATDIRTLRDVGFNVSAISALLAARKTPAWTSALALQRDALTRELAAARGRLTLINHLLEGDTMPITVERSTIPAMTVVTLRGTVPTYADEGQLWQQMTPQVEDQQVRPVGPCGVIEHDQEYTERDVDLSVFLPVEAGTTVEGPLQVLELPERDCLVATVHGPYDRISHAHDRITDVVQAEGLRPRSGDLPRDKAFNLYLTTPDQVSPAELVTEVCLPLV